MRDDMFKVIVERPRRGVGYYRTLRNEYRAGKHFVLDDQDEVTDEFCSQKLPMRSKRLGYSGKELNENLRPLERYLHAQVGRRWNDVYSEICAKLDTGSTVKQHVRDHLEDFISTCIEIDADGDYIEISKYGSRHLVYRGELIVDPVDGIIKLHDRGVKVNRDYRRSTHSDPSKVTLIKDQLEAIFKNGTWFLNELVRQSSTPSFTAREDLRGETWKLRTASKKDLKKYGLGAVR